MWQSLYRKGLEGNWVCLASVKKTSLHRHQKGLETNVMLVHSRWEGRKEGDKKIRNSGNRAAADTQQTLWRRLAQGQSEAVRTPANGSPNKWASSWCQGWQEMEEKVNES